MIRLYGIITLSLCLLFGAAVTASAAVGSWLWSWLPYPVQIDSGIRETNDRLFTDYYAIDRSYGITVVLARMSGTLSIFLRLAVDHNGHSVLTICADTCDLWMFDGEFVRRITDTPDFSDMYPTWNPLMDGSLAFASCDAAERFCDMMLWDGVTIQNLTNSPNLSEQFAVWSSDGRLAFNACGVNQLCDVMMWDSAVVHNLTNTPNVGESFERWGAEGRIGIQYCSVCSSLAYMDGEELTWLSDIPPVQVSP